MTILAVTENVNSDLAFPVTDCHLHVLNRPLISMLITIFTPETRKQFDEIVERDFLPEVNKLRNYPIAFYLNQIIKFLQTGYPFGHNWSLPVGTSKLDFSVDQLAFHCIFSDDQDIFNFIRENLDSEKFSELSTILFTGLTNIQNLKEMSLQVLQNYLDRTSDLELVAKMVLNGSAEFVKSSSEVKSWVTEYLHFLNNQKKFQTRIEYVQLYHNRFGNSDQILPHGQTNKGMKILKK